MFPRYTVVQKYSQLFTHELNTFLILSIQTNGTECARARAHTHTHTQVKT